MRPLIFAALFLIIAPACASWTRPLSLVFAKSVSDPPEVSKVLAAGEFGALAQATCSGGPCQVLWLRSSKHSNPVSEHGRIPQDGQLGLTKNGDDYFISFRPDWFSASTPEIKENQLRRIQKEARDALGVKDDDDDPKSYIYHTGQIKMAVYIGKPRSK